MENKFNLRIIYSSEAGRMLLVSIFLFFIFFAIVGYAFLRDLVLGRTLFGAFVAHTLGGRAAGVGLCIAFDVNIYATILYNMFLEVLIVCFSFSLFLFSFNNQYFQFGFLQKAIKNSERNARKYEEVISRYGWIGIFIFVMIPLPITGPVVGSFIAYFLCFSFKKIFLTAFAGTFIAIVLWSVFFEFLSDHITKIQGVLVVIAIVIVVYFLKHIRNWFSKDGFGA
ncbi:MAG: small multi-drug export protein [Desulfobacteraceae bacterium]|nr:small multi-drug export protein [Desulfobacteraceae bacterium]MBC2754467.1 small multi-drug export protein [Desulfobacteraceae bacterium]